MPDMPTQTQTIPVENAVPAAPAPDYQQILKPAASWKTTLAKVEGALAMIAGTINVAAGAIQLASGRGKNFNTEISPKAMGAIMMTGGAVSGIIGKAVWDSASAATRARNFADLQQQLNAQSSVAR